MKISEITARVINGDYPDIARPNEERVILCNDQITQYYATIIGVLLLDNIPAERAEIVVPKRLRLFDDIVRTINILRISRLNCLLEELDAIIENSKKDKDIWLSKKSANNICTFITEFWVWSEQDRVDFINGTDEVDEDELDVDLDMVYAPEKRDADTCEENGEYGDLPDAPDIEMGDRV